MLNGIHEGSDTCDGNPGNETFILLKKHKSTGGMYSHLKDLCNTE